MSSQAEKAAILEDAMNEQNERLAYMMQSQHFGSCYGKRQSGSAA